MKLLLISDVEEPYLWDYYRPGRLDSYDLILSAGDLSAEYLRFLVTMSRCPLFYVHGNHDSGYKNNPPEGCDCIDGKIIKYQGLRILGLGGSYRYRNGDHQYDEREMEHRISKTNFKIRRMGGVDLVLTHAPVAGHGDMSDLPHRGFECFKKLIDRYHPQYFIHGHIHLNYGQQISRKRVYGETTILNAHGRCELEI